MDPKILQISIYYCFATQNFFWEKKNHHFFKIPLWVFKILKISKIEKKVKIDNFFSDDAYKWAFFAKSAFFDLFAWKMLKKRSKNHESIGWSKRFLSIFAIFERSGFLRDSPNLQKWQKSTKTSYSTLSIRDFWTSFLVFFRQKGQKKHFLRKMLIYRHHLKKSCQFSLFSQFLKFSRF